MINHENRKLTNVCQMSNLTGANQHGVPPCSRLDRVFHGGIHEDRSGKFNRRRQFKF
jgi:hypothetical protein